MKKFFALSLALCMLLTVLAVQAEEKPTLTMGTSATAVAGMLTRISSRSAMKIPTSLSARQMNALKNRIPRQRRLKRLARSSASV